MPPRPRGGAGGGRARSRCGRRNMGAWGRGGGRGGLSAGPGGVRARPVRGAGRAVPAVPAPPEGGRGGGGRGRERGWGWGWARPGSSRHRSRAGGGGAELSRAEPRRACPAGRGAAAEQEAVSGRGHGRDRLSARHQVRGGREGDPEPAQKWWVRRGGPTAAGPSGPGGHRERAGPGGARPRPRGDPGSGAAPAVAGETLRSSAVFAAPRLSGKAPARGLPSPARSSWVGHLDQGICQLPAMSASLKFWSCFNKALTVSSPLLKELTKWKSKKKKKIRTYLFDKIYDDNFF